MSDVETYQITVRTCAVAMALIEQWDVPKIIAAIENANAVGPIIDPTMYREKSKAMSEDEELLRAALPLWKLAKNLKKRAMENPDGR